MSKANPTIMVVEDETLLLQAITKKLKLSGMDVLSCASGQQGVDYLSSLEELPDAVWLDYYLRDMNGLAFMQELKAKPEWSNIPVIVVSNSASPDKVNNMLALGAKKYILKAEYRLDEIISMIRDFILENEGPAEGAVPTPFTTPADAARAAVAADAGMQTPAGSDAAAALPATPAAPAVADAGVPAGAASVDTPAPAADAAAPAPVADQTTAAVPDLAVTGVAVDAPASAQPAATDSADASAQTDQKTGQTPDQKDITTPAA